ncbi:MAG: M50 family metallopeptidase [Clostridia bacterium]|nr:M50 family metallopeptidase [Clostridia bacterium]
MKKLGIHPLFFALGIVFVIVGLSKLFLVYLLVVILHELAHSFVAQKLGYKIDKVFLLPFGVGLTLEQNFVDEKDEIIVALAGPILNFFLGFICIALWWIEPLIYNYTQEFVFANIVTGLVNLLPCYPLDGGRIFVGLMSKKFDRKKSLKYCFLINYLISFIFLIYFLFNYTNNINFTFIIMAIFIFLGTMDTKFVGNYNLINIPFVSKPFKNKQVLSVNTIAVKSEIQIYKIAKLIKKNKFNLIYLIFDNKIKLINENILEKLFLNYPLTTKINNIYKNN